MACVDAWGMPASQNGFYTSRVMTFLKSRNRHGKKGVDVEYNYLRRWRLAL